MKYQIVTIEDGTPRFVTYLERFKAPAARGHSLRDYGQFGWSVIPRSPDYDDGIGVFSLTAAYNNVRWLNKTLEPGSSEWFIDPIVPDEQ